MWQHVKARNQPWVLFLRHHLPWVFLLLLWDRVCHCGSLNRLVWLASEPRGCSCLCLPRTAITRHFPGLVSLLPPSRPLFFLSICVLKIEIWSSNFKASTLLTEHPLSSLSLPSWVPLDLMPMVATQLSFTVCSSSLTRHHCLLPLHMQENLAELSPLSEVFRIFSCQWRNQTSSLFYHDLSSVSSS